MEVWKITYKQLIDDIKYITIYETAEYLEDALSNIREMERNRKASVKFISCKCVSD